MIAPSAAPIGTSRQRWKPQRKEARILQVVLSLTPGGTEHLVVEICKRLTKSFEVTVCCLDDRGAWAADAAAHGVEVVALHRPSGFQPEVGRRIARVAAERSVDLLHCHQYSPFVYGRIAKYWNPRLQLVYTEHGRLSDAPPTWKRRLVNPVLSRFDGAIVAVSEELRRYMLEARFPAARVAVIRNGIEAGPRPSPADRHAARRALGIAAETFVAVSVARLDPVKDFGTLLDAFATVRRRAAGARLLIVGDGPERAAIAERAAQPDLDGAVHLIGFRSDVRALIAAADVYVNSSISEGISITILEAMAAGLPVVATAVGGTPEVLANGAGGLLVPSRDAERLASAILALAADPQRRAVLGAAARRRLETSFTIDRMVDEYVATYRGLLG
jgi:glycosyltransferase involved in cell wall biosynthesis